MSTLLQAVEISMSQIRAHLVRSLLTGLGVLIGTAAVVAVVAIGHGATQRVAHDIAELGPHLLTITPGGDRRTKLGGAPAAFGALDLTAIRHDIPSITMATGRVERSVVASFAGIDARTKLIGIDNDYFAVRNRRIVSGRAFEPGELQVGKPVCLLGDAVRDKLFGHEDPIGAIVQIGTIPCRVTGLVDRRGRTAIAEQQDDLILAPRAFLEHFTGSDRIEIVDVSAMAGGDSSATAEITALLRDRRHIRPQEADDFEIHGTSEILRAAEGLTGSIGLFASIVGMISLLVGGIGISNVMLVAASERTEEIGIRLAIGAEQNDILIQFLVEAVSISLLGGTLGVMLGLVSSKAICGAIGFPWEPDPVSACGAFVISGLLGVFFGFLPARRAAHQDPVRALRHE